jgi:hypothetical protein
MPSRTHSPRAEENAVNEPIYRVGDPAPPPLPRRAEAEVMARWQGDEPVVSILCATYQHVGFVEDALRGFLGQDTDFPFEIIVRDDASTDGTADIVRDYAERYPNIIRAVLETENRWPEVKASQVLRTMARGAFTAFCEGDDYWISQNFLSRARGELLKYANAPGAVGWCVVRDTSSIIGYEHPKQSEWNFYFPVRALLFRSNIQLPNIPWVAGDNILAIALQQLGTVRSLNEYVAVYRKHAGGVVSGLSHSEFRPQQAAGLTACALYLAEQGDISRAETYQKYAIQKLLWLLEPFGVVPELPRRSWAMLFRRAVRKCWIRANRTWRP